MMVKGNIDTTEEYQLNDKGNVEKTVTGSTEIDRYDFLDYLADEKLSYLQQRERIQEQIRKLQQQLTDEDQRITNLYRKIIPAMKAEEKEYLKQERTTLNNKLAEAFPSDFEKHVPTISADEGGVATDPKKYYDKRDPRSDGDTINRVG